MQNTIDKINGIITRSFPVSIVWSGIHDSLDNPEEIGWEISPAPFEVIKINLFKHESGDTINIVFFKTIHGNMSGTVECSRIYRGEMPCENGEIDLDFIGKLLSNYKRIGR